MSRFEYNNGIVTNGLVLNLDAGDPDSYTRSQPPYVEVLVVAGGGAGGGNLGGGGGAGGVIYNSAYQLTNAAAVTVTIGAGGAGVTGTQSGVQGNDGSNSVFGSLTAIGGGGAGSGTDAITGRNGGSGGGASGYYTAAGGTGTAGQGFNGGSGGGGSPYYGGGGGGGAGAPGADGVDGSVTDAAGDGGDGMAYSILGTTYYFGGGGGGGVYYNSDAGNGGLGGGGGGGSMNSGYNGTGGGQALNAGQDGTADGTYPGFGLPGGGNGGANTGGGGGGAQHQQHYGGNGGSGIVIVRYPGLPAATGGTITYLNGYTIHTFTSSGTFTPYPWNDISGNNNSGSLINGVGFNSYQNGGYLSFDGVDDRVATSFKPSGYRSYFVWIKYNITSSLPAGYSLTGTQEVNAYNYVGIENGGKFYYYFGTNGESLAGTVLSPNVWYYQGLTLSSDGYARAYLNGTLVSTLSSGVGNTATNEFSVGCINQNHWVNGSIASVVQYNRTLSQAEITQNYNAQKARFGL